MSTKQNNIQIAIVASNFNKDIVDRLYNGAISTLEKSGIGERDIEVIRVPGAFEIPVAVKLLLNKKQYDVIITLGVIIKGETPHFEYIASAVANGVMRSSQLTNIPMTFGILTTNSIEEALARTGPEESNKGWEAANAAIDLIETIRQINLIDNGVSNKR